MLSSSSSSGMNFPVDNNSSSLSATKVANNSDILSQILLCLPVKSLLIFKSVSKKWLFLISDPYFANNHSCRKTSFKIPGLFIEKLRRPSGPPDDPEFEFPFIFLNNDNDDDATTGGGGVPLKTLDFVEVPPRNWEGPIAETSLRIEHSCNGLLCCTRITSQMAKEPRIVIHHIYIYNPTTKRYKALPRSPFRDVVKDYWNGVKSVSLAFDPIKSPDHYQVICIWVDIGKFEEHDLYYIEIYSSKTNSWRLSAESPFSARPLSSSRAPGVLWNCFLRPGVFWNGCLHWISIFSTMEDEASVYFDIEQDLVKPLPLPAVPNDDVWNFKYIGECRNHLYLVGIIGSCPDNYSIFEMEKDYSGWNLIYKLDLERIINAYHLDTVTHYNNTMDYYVWVMFLGEAEEKSSTKLVLLINATQLISYDLKEMSYREIYHFDPKTLTMTPGSGSRGYVHQYIPSLACV
ncbi:F-box protein At5g07610-like [Papaver somniferum]|nr:F-box protein At5g07610-like [Papaver somniferum]